MAIIYGKVTGIYGNGIIDDVNEKGLLSARSTSLFKFGSSGYFSKANSIVEKVFSSLKHQKEC